VRETRLFFDEKRMSRDVLVVLEAAARLDISEFELFRLAHERWFGGPIDDDRLEKLYLPYMFRDEVPVWVRHLARDILATTDDALDPADFGVRPRPLSMATYQRGLRLSLWVILVFGAFLTGAMTLAKLQSEVCGLLPPCY
jgi:hypothetical protein